MMTEIDVHLHPTYKCNLSCVHCYNSSGQDYNGPELSAAQTVHIIRSLCETYACDMHLEGGELLLLPEVIEGLAALSPDDLSRVTITTNGTIRVKGPRALSSLTSVGCLRISIEGHLDEQQRSIRNINLKHVLGNAAYYQSLGSGVVLRMTLTALNRPSLVSESLPFFECQGFRRLQIYGYQATGRGARHASLEYSGPFITLIDELCRYSPRGPMSIGVMLPQKYLADINRRSKDLSDAGWLVTAAATRPSLSIHPDGSIYCCPWSVEGAQPVANLVEGIARIKELIDSGSMNHECHHCTSVVLRREWE